MSKFSRFMKSNKTEKKNEFYAPTKSLLEEDGKPLKWEFKRITSREHDEIKDSCTVDVPITGKPNLFRPKLKTSSYLSKLVAESVVTPDLLNAELQDSYGVSKPEELVQAMVDDPGEYSALVDFVQRFQGLTVSFSDEVEEAKN